MDCLVGCPFHSNDHKIFIITILMEKMLDPDFSVQSVNKIHIIKFETFELPGFPTVQAYDPLWYLSSAITGDGIQKAEWIIQPLPRVKSLRLLSHSMTPDLGNHVAENMLSGVELQLLPSSLSILALEIMLQKIYGLKVSNYEVTIRLVTPEIMLQKNTIFRGRS